MKKYNIYAGDAGLENLIRVVLAENDDKAEEKMCALMQSHRWFRSWLLQRADGKVIAGRMWF